MTPSPSPDDDRRPSDGPSPKRPRTLGRAAFEDAVREQKTRRHDAGRGCMCERSPDPAPRLGRAYASVRVVYGQSEGCARGTRLLNRQKTQRLQSPTPTQLTHLAVFPPDGDTGYRTDDARSLRHRLDVAAADPTWRAAFVVGLTDALLSGDSDALRRALLPLVTDEVREGRGRVVDNTER